MEEIELFCPIRIKISKNVIWTSAPSCQADDFYAEEAEVYVLGKKKRSKKRLISSISLEKHEVSIYSQPVCLGRVLS